MKTQIDHLEHLTRIEWLRLLGNPHNLACQAQIRQLTLLKNGLKNYK